MNRIHQSEKALLVGDNPFHNISHLSQERTRARGDNLADSSYAADLILTSVANGANGFMFSVSEKTLSILSAINKKGEIGRLNLYPIVPYAYEYVKLATQTGGIPGLAKRFSKQVVMSGNFRAVVNGIRGVVGMNPISLVKTYVAYEMSRIKSSAGKRAKIESIILHEIVTDMALALNLEWFFKGYIDFVSKTKVVPGFNTCNFAYLVNKLEEWEIDLSDVFIVAPFNSVGFQMNPSRTACEEALKGLKKPTLIAISILAAGYLKPEEAVRYIAGLPNVKGVAVGVSKEKHAVESFRLLNEALDKNL